MPTIAELLTQAVQYHQRGSLNLAERMYYHILELEPTHPGALNGLAVVLAQHGMLDDATGYFEQALKVCPKDTNLLNNLGLLHARKGNHERAIERFQQTLQQDANVVDAHFNMAN